MDLKFRNKRQKELRILKRHLESEIVKKETLSLMDESHLLIIHYTDIVRLKHNLVIRKVAYLRLILNSVMCQLSEIKYADIKKH